MGKAEGWRFGDRVSSDRRNLLRVYGFYLNYAVSSWQPANLFVSDRKALQMTKPFEFSSNTFEMIPQMLHETGRTSLYIALAKAFQCN